jgi:hypothetical protein
MTDEFMDHESTSVVPEESGLAEAYARKAEELEYWLSDDEPMVREFAKQYIEQLGRQQQHERRHATESTDLRKHKFRIGDESENCS